VPKNLVQLDAELDVGITPSLENSDVRFWKDGLNITFIGSAIRPFFSQAEVATPLGTRPIRGKILETRIAGTKYAFMGDQRKLFRFDGASIADVTRLSGDYNGLTDESDLEPATSWSMAQWGDWAFAAQEKDKIQVYKPPATRFVDLDTQNGAGAWGAAGQTFDYASIVMGYKSFLLAFNTTNLTVNGNGGSDFYHWCKSDDTNTWIPGGAGNSAGYNQARDAGPILAATYFRGSIVFATKNSVHLLRYVGSPSWFGQEILAQGFGVLGKNCLYSTGNMLYGVGIHGIWASDGAQFVNIGSPVVHDYFMDRLSRKQSSKTLLWHNKEEDSLEIHFPVDGSLLKEPEIVLASRMENKTWTFLDRARTAGSDGSVFGSSLSASSKGRLYAQSRGAEDSVFEPRPGPMTVGVQESSFAGYGEGGYGDSGYSGVQSLGYYDDFGCLMLRTRPAQALVVVEHSTIGFNSSFAAVWKRRVEHLEAEQQLFFLDGSLFDEFLLTVLADGRLKTLNTTSVDSVIKVGEWHDLVVDVTGAKISVYVDGVLALEDPWTSFVTSSLSIGDSVGGSIKSAVGYARNYRCFSTTGFDKDLFLDPEALEEKLAWMLDYMKPELYYYCDFDYTNSNRRSSAGFTVFSTFKYTALRTRELEDERLVGRQVSDAFVLVFKTNLLDERISYGVGATEEKMAFLESKFLDAGDPRISKFVFNVISEISKRKLTNPLKLKLLYKNTLDEEAQEKEILLDAFTKRLRLPGAKWIALRIEDTRVDEIWRITKLMINATIGGGRIK
jgi:hypothetical protein